MSISKAKVPAWDKLGVDGSRKVLFTASDTYDWLIYAVFICFRVFVCWGSDWPWVTHAVSAVPECLTPATLLTLSNFNSLVAVAYSEWLNVLIIELDALSGALNIIQIPNESPMTFTAYKFSILVNSRFAALACFSKPWHSGAFAPRRQWIWIGGRAWRLWEERPWRAHVQGGLEARAAVRAFVT